MFEIQAKIICTVALIRGQLNPIGYFSLSEKMAI